MKWTPLHIQLMLHYYAIASAVENSDAPAVLEYTQDLLKHGLIREGHYSSKYNATEKGEKFVEKLCKTELPKQVWV